MQSTQSPSPGRGAWLPVLLVLGSCLLLAGLQPAFFWKDDAQLYFLPVLIDSARALLHGELPLLSPFSWQCANLAGEYQAGTFSVVVMGLATILLAIAPSLSTMATCLITSHLMILAAGTYLLVRKAGPGHHVATAAAVSLTLSGFLALMGAQSWYPVVFSFAWLPWAWWSLKEASETSRPAWIAFTSLFTYLVLAAGWPFTVLMLVLCYLAELLAHRRWKAWAATILAGLGGVGLAAPALLMLLNGFGSSQSLARGIAQELTLPAGSLPGFLYPAWIAHWTTVAHGNVNMPSFYLSIGIVLPIAIALMAFWRPTALARPGLWKHFALLALGTYLATHPSLGRLRWSYRWLPFIQLNLAMIGAIALQQWEAHRKDLPRWALLAATGVILALGMLNWLRFPIGTGEHLKFAAVFLGTVVTLAVWHQRTTNSLLLTAAALASTLVPLALTPMPSSRPAFPFGNEMRQPGALESGRTYLSIISYTALYQALPHKEAPAWGQMVRPGNTGMLAGITTVNGYSPMEPAGFGELLHLVGMGAGGFASSEALQQALATGSKPHGLFESLGIDGLLVDGPARPQAEAHLPANGWVLATRGAGAQVWHRKGPPTPIVRSATDLAFATSLPETSQMLESGSLKAGSFVAYVPVPSLAGKAQAFSPVTWSNLRMARNSLTMEVANGGPRPGLVVVQRSFVKGWQARLDGQNLPVNPVDLLLTAVAIPPGASGHLELFYWPESLTWGLVVAGLTAMALLVGCGLSWFRRKIPGAPQDKPGD